MADIVENPVPLEEMSNLSLRLKDIQKHGDHIEWEDYFMAIACLVSNRSKDPSSQVGACIVNPKNRIVGQGYNGMPRGCSDDDFPWGKQSCNPLETKYFYVCHAEMNAIFNRNCANISGCTIYTILFPCNQCAKMIIQSGIKEVVYLCDKNKSKPEAMAAIKMLDASSTAYRQFKPSCKGYTINLNTCVCEKSLPNSIPHELSCRDKSRKRENCLPWDEYFLAISILAAKRSKCPESQLGACIVNPDNHIVGLGYNGMPHGCHDDDFPWRTDSEDPLDNKQLYECHAELNAILNSGLQVKGFKMYTIAFPCNECAKAIIQSGISEVIYIREPENEPACVAARKMFDAKGLKYRRHTPKQDKIYVDFTLIDL